MGNFFLQNACNPKTNAKRFPAKLPRQTAGHRVMDQGEFPLANLFHGPTFATRFAWFSVASAVFVESVQNMSSAACHAHQPPKTSKAARTKPACKFVAAPGFKKQLRQGLTSIHGCFFLGGGVHMRMSTLFWTDAWIVPGSKGFYKIEKDIFQRFWSMSLPFLFWPGDSRQHSQNSACQQYPLA